MFNIQCSKYDTKFSRQYDTNTTLFYTLFTYNRRLGSTDACPLFYR